MKKYLSMFKKRLAVGLEYRSNIFGQFVLDGMALIATIIFWNAVFQSQNHLGTFSLNDSILYFFITPLVGAFTYVFISEELGYEIRMGAFSNYLLKPYSLLFEALTRALASKLNTIISTAPFYAVLLIVMSFVTRHFVMTPLSVLFFIVTIFMGFTLHFVFDLAISHLAFWIGEVWAFAHFKRVVFLIFGGLLFPLDFLPKQLFNLFALLPFQFMYYIPCSYLLGKRTISNIPHDAILFIVWLIIFIIIQKVMWKRGLIKYEAFGG